MASVPVIQGAIPGAPTSGDPPRIYPAPGPTAGATRADCTTRSPSPRAFSVADAAGAYPARFAQIGPEREQFDIIQGRLAPEGGWTWINENPLLHWAPLSPDATVWIYPGGNDPSAQLQRMPITAIDEYPTGEGRVFWLTFDDGMIVDVCEQWSE